MKTLINDFPEIVRQWHTTKNGENTPENVTFASAKKIWFCCDKGHEWLARVFARTKNGSGCPVCLKRQADATSNLTVLFPLVAAEWHPTKNKGILPENTTPGSAKIFWWQCSKGHEWKTSVTHRTRDGCNCPYCCNQKVDIKNCLATLRPDLLLEWHHSNIIDPCEVGLGSVKRILWKCPKAEDHIWDATIISRAKGGTGCPACSGRKVVKSNCLSTIHPLVASEWHPTKNGRLTPDMVTSQSNKYAWFQCSNNSDHVWRTSICHRGRGSGCPVCSSSEGEKKIKAILEELKIPFKKEFTFKCLRYKGPLRFDFGILKDKKAIALIEYQGKHHYQCIEWFGGDKTFQDVLIKDNIKKSYCEKNNIPLLIIPYWDLKEINKIIQDFTIDLT